MSTAVTALAAKIAEEANKCCHRADGYEEGVAAFAEEHILAFIDEINQKERTVLTRWLKLLDRGYGINVADDIRAMLSVQP